MIRIAFSLLLLFWLVPANTSLAHDEVDARAYDPPRPVAPFILKDQNGSPFTTARLQGRWSLVFLGYTHCPDVCPFTLANLAAVQSALSEIVGEGALPQIVFLSIDPDRDAAILPEYVTYFDKSFLGVTGARADIDSLVKSIDGFYELKTSGASDDVNEVSHSASVAVIGPDVTVKAKINPPFPPEETAKYLRRLMSGGATN